MITGDGKIEEDLLNMTNLAKLTLVEPDVGLCQMMREKFADNENVGHKHTNNYFQGSFCCVQQKLFLPNLYHILNSSFVFRNSDQYLLNKLIHLNL